MSEQSVMTTPIFDELVNELGSRPEQEPAGEVRQDGEQSD